jgi:hypothetical protein
MAAQPSTAQPLPPVAPAARMTRRLCAYQPLPSRYSRARARVAAQGQPLEIAARSCRHQLGSLENVGRGQAHVAHEPHQNAVGARVADFRPRGPVLDHFVALRRFGVVQRGGELDELAGNQAGGGVRVHGLNIAHLAWITTTVRRMEEA